MRNRKKLELLDTPFDTIAHTLDVRQISSRRGYYNISNIGLFLWRLQAYPVVNAPAYPHDEVRFSFNQLGYDMPLFNHPEIETEMIAGAARRYSRRNQCSKCHSKKCT